MWDKVLMAIGALKDMSSTYANLQDKGGGVGGASPAQTQAGQTGLQYQDVAGTGISPFEYQEYQEQLAEEDEQRQMAEAMALAQQQGLWSGGIIGLMQGGPLYANEGSPLSSEAEEWKRFFESRPESVEAISLDIDEEVPEVIEEVVVEAEQPTPTLTIEDLKADLDQMIRQQKIRDAFEAVGGLVENIAKIRNPQKSTISPRKSVTPLPGGGLGKRQAPYPQPKGSGITPFMFQPAAGGGEVLGRSMFAQNYMPHGGAMQGPGGPKDDLIPVMASDGEYMLSKAAVDQAGGGNHTRGIANLEQFNNMGNRRYG
jgi:hypothetical protein